MGQGLGRRPGHAHRRGPRGAPARPAAGARRRLPGRRARGRDGGRVRLLPPRPGRRGAVDRHRDARARRRRPRRPPPSRLGDRAGHGGRRRGADARGVRRPRGLGAVAPAGVPAGPRHRGDPRGEPGGHRLHPRRPRDHRLGRDQRRVRGGVAGDHRHRGAVHRRARASRAVRPAAGGLRAAGRGRAPGARRRPAADRARAGLDRPPAGRALHRRPGRARLPGPQRAPATRRAGDVVPRPLPADQDPAAGARPAADGVPRGRDRAAARAPRGVPRRLRGLLRAARGARQPADARRGPLDRPRPGRGHVQLRRGQADRAGGRRVLPQRDPRHARRRGGVDVRADPRGREVPDRVLGARGGEARPPAEGPGRSPPGSRW